MLHAFSCIGRPFLGQGAGCFITAVAVLACCRPVSTELRSTKPHDVSGKRSIRDCVESRAGLDRLWLALSGAAVAADNNVVISPVGVSAALAMAHAGAEGNTARELSLVLGGGQLAQAQFHFCMMTLWEALAPKSRSDTVELRHASGVWLQQGLAVEPGFLDNLSAYYDAGVQVVDFEHGGNSAAMAINEWASSRTLGQIRDAVSSASLSSDTRLLLAQAMYLRARWANPFRSTDTFAAAFRTSGGARLSWPMMHRTLSIPYLAGDGFKAAAFPYSASGWSMLVVLPDANRLQIVRKELSGEWFQRLRAGLKERVVSVALPKLRLRSTVNSLRALLETLGMHDAFSDRDADSSALSRTVPMRLSDLKQHAVLAVDELGTEAAAVAAAEVVTASANGPNEVETFSADHPFLFFVVGPGGSVVFAGQLVDPSS